MTFSISGSNGGMIVPPNHYLENQNNGNLGAGIVDSALSNGDYGFSLTDTVAMMVSGKMGALIPEMQANITNANVQKGALSQFELTMSMLAKNTIKPLNQKNALTSYELSNSNPNAIGASISGGGISGDLDLSIGVQQLAQSQSLQFGGFADASAPLKAGSITINFGSYGADSSFTQNGDSAGVTIEIKEGMTLTDLAGQINRSSPDIKATIVTKEDGTSELALISQKTGQNHAMQVIASGDPSLNGFNFNGAETDAAKEVRKATDAQYTVNGVQMTSSTNKIEDVFGLNLSLTEVTVNDVKISATTSPQGVVDNITAFVENFNSMMDMFNSFNDSTPANDYVGSLYKTGVSEDVTEALDKLFSKVSSDGTSLKDIGITRDSDGRLSLNQDTLVSALKKDPEIAYKILGSITESSHGSVQISDIGGAISGDHTLVVTRAPEKAQMVGSALGAEVVLSADTELKLKLGGKEVTVSLAAGSHTPEGVVNAINLAATKAGISGYQASIVDGAISINSSEYGALKSIEVVSDVPELGLVAGKFSGVDVAGTINGEPFLGDGATFESKFDDATKGMKITFDPKTLVLDEDIILTTNKGFLSNLDSTIKDISKSTSLEIKEIKDKLDKTKNDSFVAQLEALQKKEQYYYDMYYSQFSGVSATLAQMDSTIEMMEAMFDSKE